MACDQKKCYLIADIVLARTLGKEFGCADILVAVSRNKAVTRPLRCVAVARVCLLRAVCICKGSAYDCRIENPVNFMRLQN